jgi:hypothetical protein
MPAAAWIIRQRPRRKTNQDAVGGSASSNRFVEQTDGPRRGARFEAPAGDPAQFHPLIHMQ